MNQYNNSVTLDCWAVTEDSAKPRIQSEAKLTSAWEGSGDNEKKVNFRLENIFLSALHHSICESCII